MKKWAIISGHSRGLGQALAQGYLDQGYHVIGLARHSWPQPPALLQQVNIDLGNENQLTDWLAANPFTHELAQAKELILINNAGVVEPNALTGQQNPAAIVQAVKINVMAPLLLTNALIETATKAKVPLRIAHISSGAGRKAYPGWSIYGATKAALDQHAEAVAAEKHPGVRIASIAPGVVNTDMQAQIRASREDQFPLRSNFVDLYASQRLQTPATTAQMIMTMMAAADYGQVVKRDVRQ
ncbi:SDR family NAD(P)-dependent oxidoreductase [Neisseriaceae bacterium ESL0693]|nr:SDR family NAD(P)-dependent oxidoreductase [Neisseriaceae bacterium ESL0693]